MTRRIADRYLLGEQIGVGATSRVHAALDERLDRRVAVKLLDAGLVASSDPAGRERFLREGPAAASFTHAHAVNVYDAGEDGGDLYIVMELVEGPSLAEYLVRSGPLPVDDATRIAGQVLDALAAAHATGLVHRDVKPANVLLDGRGDAKLADFGIAKRFDELDGALTSTGTVIGTPRYLAPEQAVGAPVTPATDVYAMGVLLFEMLTGRPPFAGDSLVAVSLLQQSQDAPDVRSLRPEVAPRLAAVVARALARDPADRYPTAFEMGGDLRLASSAPGPVVATQAMDAVVRSGDTEIWPAAVPTAAVSAGRAARRLSPWTVGTLAALGVLMVLLAAVVLLSGHDAGERNSPVPSSASPTSTPQSTPAPPPATVAPVDEIIPGFARTDDLRVFLAQLDANPALVGSSGTALADDLRRLLDESSERKQRDRAKSLSKQLDKWVKADELDPAVAAALDELLAPLAR